MTGPEVIRQGGPAPLSAQRAPSGGPSRARRVWSRIGQTMLTLAIVAYFASGLFVIRPNEVGVVRVFGKVAATTIEGKSAPKIFLPGLHCLGIDGVRLRQEERKQFFCIQRQVERGVDRGTVGGAPHGQPFDIGGRLE